MFLQAGIHHEDSNEQNVILVSSHRDIVGSLTDISWVLHPVPIQRLRANQVTYYSLVVAVVVSVLMVSIMLASYSGISFEADDYSSYRCTTGNPDGEPFQVLTLSSHKAVAIADHMCRSPAFARTVSSVTIMWRLRGFLSAKHIVDETFDFFWNRRHLVEGMVPNHVDFYLPVLDTPTYPLYWLSRTPNMRLTPEYLADKAIGFLQNNYSQTFFLQPFKSLKEAGITLTDDQKRFYPDMTALFQAYTSGEVDIIPNPGPGMIMEIDGQSSVLLMEPRVPSGSWFLRRHWLGSGIECDLVEIYHHDPLFDQQSTPVPGSLDCPGLP